MSNEADEDPGGGPRKFVAYLRGGTETQEAETLSYKKVRRVFHPVTSKLVFEEVTEEVSERFNSKALGFGLETIHRLSGSSWVAWVQRIGLVTILFVVAGVL